jgi:hypothetical protein
LGKKLPNRSQNKKSPDLYTHRKITIKKEPYRMSIVFWLIGEGITKTVSLKIHKKVTMPTYAYAYLM